MENFIKQGATMVVCGGNPLVHGFNQDEIVTVEQVRPEPELSHVALCRAVGRPHVAILMYEELEELC